MPSDSASATTRLPDRFRHLRDPPWQGRWTTLEGDPKKLARLVAYDEESEREVSFYFPRNILVAACDYFAAALSGNWAETQDTTVGTAAAEQSLGALSLQDASQNSPNIQSEQPALPTLRFDQGAMAVYDLLTFIHPNEKFNPQPQTVESLLHLADMIGFDALKSRCAKALEAKLWWDPVDTLNLAETYRLKELYSLASQKVLEDFEESMKGPWHRLSDETIIKLLHRRAAFYRGVALITVRTAQGQLNNKCFWCKKPRSSKPKSIRATVQRALDAETRFASSFKYGAMHTGLCPGSDVLEVLSMGVDLDSECPDVATMPPDELMSIARPEMRELLLCAARQVRGKDFNRLVTTIQSLTGNLDLSIFDV